MTNSSEYNIKAKAQELLANAPVTRFIGHDFVPKEAAIRAIATAIAAYQQDNGGK